MNYNSTVSLPRHVLKEVVRQTMEIIKPPEYLSPDAIGEILKCSPESIRNWCGNGSMKSCRFGRQIRVKATDLNQFCLVHEVVKVNR
jgi:excisionase family DNA binding protein